MHKMLYRGVCVACICMAAHAFLAAAPFPHATPMSCCLDMLPRYYGFVSGWGAATHGGGGRNPAATTPPPWVRWEKKKGVESCEMGLSRLFFCMGEHGVARNSFSNAPACRPQPHFATNNHPCGVAVGG